MQPPVAIAPLPRMGARTPALFPFKDEWPGQIHNYQKVDALARQWEHLLMLADQTQTSEDQIKLVRRRMCVCQRCTFLAECLSLTLPCLSLLSHNQNGLRADRYRWNRQLGEVESILAADIEKQHREWDAFRIGAIGSGNSGVGKQPSSFDEYLDSLHFQQWYIEQALRVMDVEAIDGKIAKARESSYLGRVSQSACNVM